MWIAVKYGCTNLELNNMVKENYFLYYKDRIL